jgi:hypothetical protein
MNYTIPIAVGLGLVFGLLISHRMVNEVLAYLGKNFIATRFVQACAFIGVIVLLLPSLFLSFVVGGNLGGSWGEYVTQSLGLGLLGVPIGLAIGIALILTISISLGALIGGLVGVVVATIKRRLNQR